MTIALEARQKAAETDHEARMHMALTIETLARKKHLPSLKKLTAKAKAEQPVAKQSAGEMLARFRAMQAAGAPMTIRRIK